LRKFIQLRGRRSEKNMFDFSKELKGRSQRHRLSTYAEERGGMREVFKREKRRVEGT